MEVSAVEVTIITPSRLHFSMIDMRGDLGRIHGSVGVAIEKPRIVLKARECEEIRTKGFRPNRVKDYAIKILEDSNVHGGVEFELVSDIPEHSGFGSGTQLGLAVGTAVSELLSLDLTTDQIAMKLNRSRRSGIGTHAFKHGGFIVDGGHKTEKREGIPPMIFRADVPDDWLFVVGVPEIERIHSGSVEKNAFNMINPPPPELIGEISRIVLLQMIPAIFEEDITTFGEAMTNIDFKFGEFWEDIQGGKFTHPGIESGVNYLRENGALGVGQSSWGPAFYGLVQGVNQAQKLEEMLKRFLNEDGKQGDAFITTPNNYGAIIEKE